MENQIASSQADFAPHRTARIQYLDTLRVLAVLMVFVFHATKAFTAGEWHVMNDQTSMIASILFVAFLAPWGMPFFFLLAGAGTWFALQRRTTRQFAGERLQRLLIPFLIGSAVFSPIQAFFEWRHSVRVEGYIGSFIQFNLERFGGWNPTLSNWIGYHLWFLIFLFTFSLLTLPLLARLREPDQKFNSWVVRLCERRGGILIFAFLPLMIQAGLRPIFPGAQNWADFFYDLFFFLSGYMIYADERFLRIIRRDWWLLLAAGAAALLGIMVTLVVGQAEALFSDPTTPGYRLFWALAGVDAWCWSLLMLFIGMRFLDFSNKWTRYGQEAVVPFYLIHQPVIVALAFYVVQWQTSITVKMLVVGLGSLAISAALYEAIIRRLQPLRSSFGMKAFIHLRDTPVDKSTPISHSIMRPPDG